MLPEEPCGIHVVTVAGDFLGDNLDQMGDSWVNVRTCYSFHLVPENQASEDKTRWDLPCTQIILGRVGEAAVEYRPGHCKDSKLYPGWLLTLL